jgi:glycosyltransferase involved in cell wall biosynthesis
MRDKRQRIIIVATSDLSTDQRVLKIAGTFHRHGWDVLLIGRLLPASRTVETDVKYHRMKLIFRKSFLFYLEYNLRLGLLLVLKPFDTIYANDTDTLPGAFFASRIKRKKLIFDAHELFPEVPELQGRPFVKKVWQTIEDILLPRLKHTFTVCQSIANYYNQRYGISMQVVRNVPNRRQQQVPLPLPAPAGKKIILYQGAVNAGRGLEWVIDTMPLIDDAILYIIGDGDIMEQLQQQVDTLGLTGKVIFHGKASPEELHRYTPSADIGLCLLENKGLSYYYALPNRIFDYLHAGVPVLASPFPEIKAIVETYNTGVLTDDYSPAGLAATINTLLQERYPTGHFQALSGLFCWEEEEKKLLADSISS